MIAFVSWYLAVLALGWLALPLAYRLLPALPDRGYAFSRPLGVLVWGYSFWLLGSLGVLRNDAGGLVFALGALLALSFLALRAVGWRELRDWLRDHWRLAVAVEALFLVAFAGWAVVRAANPEIFGTEKPMELAFINAILESPTFPPHDPWLSGYAISYYYFGYVLSAMLSQLTGFPAGVAFNLTLSLVFALGVVGAYGMVYNLLAARGEAAEPDDDSERPSGALLGALFGPLFIMILGNAEGLLEILHARGVLWARDAAGNLQSGFWSWLDMQELSRPPSTPFSWLPRDFGTGGWWWWRASRVVQDYNLAGEWREIIDEFPMFSFLLGDLHPHVLAIPFVFLAMALALNLYLRGGEGEMRWRRFHLAVSPAAFGLAALVLGGLAFLNTWDFPTFLVLFAAAYTFTRVREGGWGWERGRDFVLMSVTLGLAGVLLYLPFYVGFSSQAGGAIPNLVYVTRGAHLWVMFGLFFVVLFVYLIATVRRESDVRRVGRGGLLAFAVIVALFLLAMLLGATALLIPGVGDLYLGSLGALGRQEQLFRAALFRRLQQPGAWVTLFFVLALALGALWPRRGGGLAGGIRPYVLLHVLLGAFLVLGPEFFYLQDQFGYRINTIFKFYYQAWLLWGVAVAYGAVVLLRRLKGASRLAWQIALVLVIGVGLVYPVYGVYDKAHGFSPPQGWTLDGTRNTSYLSAEDAAAVGVLETLPRGVIVEAVGGSYSNFGRVAAVSGYPTVLGWPGHESQWRGGAAEMGNRESDVELLYTTRSWEQAQEILNRYGIRYVYLGALERSAYRVSEGKFRRHLETVYDASGVTIFAVPGFRAPGEGLARRVP